VRRQRTVSLHGPRSALRRRACSQWRIQRGGAVEAATPPPIDSIFSLQKTALFRVNAYRSLCAFSINEDGADKLSSAPPSKFLDPPLHAVHRP